MSKSVLFIGLLTLATLSGVHYYFHQSSNETPAVNEAAIHDSWVHWKAKHEKLYTSSEEETLRFQIYRSNILKIADHNEKANAGEFTFVLGINEFADLTQDEFKARYLGTHPNRNPTNFKTLPTDVPASVDWRTKQAVSAVKNQGSCGSCWAFSAIGSLEGLHAITTGSLVQFSEQELVDCSTSFGNEGCNGGLMDMAFQYVEKNGIEIESDYPYSGSDGKCATTSSKTSWKINGFVDVPQNVSAQLKAAIALNPVAVAIEADGFRFQFYFGGIFSASCGTNLDHGVLAVGYGTESGKNYWVVKNSWGGSWGEKGYIRIADNGDGPGLCGIQMSASYPTL